jgi:putative methionine-R-sulfoxide reductase with GAF domain
MGPFLRDYAACERRLAADLPTRLTREERLRACVELLWEHLRGQGVDWLGVYLINDARDAMLLKECRPRPACSPIALHGVCGRAWKEGRPQVVPDVTALGEAHIVCDPANLSEVVVPLFEPDGTCYGVLDLDSRTKAAFSDADAQGLRSVLRAAGLTA